jgi:hypothetical protein
MKMGPPLATTIANIETMLFWSQIDVLIALIILKLWIMHMYDVQLKKILMDIFAIIKLKIRLLICRFSWSYSKW